MPKFRFRKTEETTRGEMNDSSDNIDLLFIKLVGDRKYQEAMDILGRVKDINIKDPKFGCNALHYCAARSALPFLKQLRGRDDLDYLAKDNEGRFASEIAWQLARNPELGQELQDLEKIAADKQGIKPWPKPESPSSDI